MLIRPVSPFIKPEMLSAVSPYEFDLFTDYAKEQWSPYCDTLYPYGLAYIHMVRP